jgi:adenylosuccinate lyase
MADLLATDSRITDFVPSVVVPTLLDATEHVGDAPERAIAVAAAMRAALLAVTEQPT